eukprot:GHVQ01004869.1.p2 GENE.GHVQ01004869.1~~GHVQ01004869.1.p2  ORF type:complete len:101 (+),score=3.72 GHVQ01004869.1:561-863(+)
MPLAAASCVPAPEFRGYINVFDVALCLHLCPRVSFYAPTYRIHKTLVRHVPVIFTSLRCLGPVGPFPFCVFCWSPAFSASFDFFVRLYLHAQHTGTLLAL